MLSSLQEFILSLPVPAQWLGVMVVSAIPFVESYFGSVIGVVSGMNPVVVVVCAVVGNFVSMLVACYLAHRGRGLAVKEPKALSPRRQKLKDRFDRYGVAGVSLLGQTILPSQITSAAMVGFGANLRTVVFWQSISIVLWGVAFAMLAHLGMVAVS